jgi:hypothetical protein
MAVIKESKGVDFVVNSKPWSEQELKEFRELMKRRKSELGEQTRSKLKKEYTDVFKQPA